MKLRLLLSLFILTTTLLSDDLFKTTYSFKNVSVNYLDWTSKTEENTPQEDFVYLEFEGGVGFDWGEFYMFFDIENPTKSWSAEPAGNMRLVLKPILDINIVDNLSLHIQDYNLQSKDFFVSNLVVGVAYKISTDFGLWIRPFIGPHYQESTYYSGMNGYMAGWAFVYDFKITKEKFSISQWHEHTFDRDSKNGYDGDIGTQGALAFWWHPTSKLTTGIQYRYASYELGNSEYQDGLIYSLKYNF